MIATASGTEPIRGHPPISDISDALARATLEALLESDAVGVALIRSVDWTHVLTNATYERLLGTNASLGRPVFEVLSEATAPRAMFEAVVSTGTAARLNDVVLGSEAVPESPAAVHVSFVFLRVLHVTPESDGILVLVQDVSQQIHERRMGELFLALAKDMSGERDEAASIRASVAHASAALGADAASIFLLSPDGKRLHGALVGWDWTRTSFVADVEDWPNVERAIAANEPSFVTAENARFAEEAWFERRGIKAAICAPMAADGRVLGVLFFDYATPSTSRVDLRLAKDVADQCALLVERAARTR
jgi:hypothetical protein